MIDTKHPDYEAQLPSWLKMFDCFQGEDHIKAQNFIYLMPTHSQDEDGARGDKLASNIGWSDYVRYRDRANYPDMVSDAIDALVGIMHRKGPVIDLPDVMKPMIDSIDLDGSSAEAFLRKVNENQLLYGRYGILVEIPDGEGPSALPFLVGYNATTLINWDKGSPDGGRAELELVVLDESHKAREGFEWKDRKMYRALRIDMDTGKYYVEIYDATKDKLKPIDTIEPSIKGKGLDSIPFVIVNAGDVIPEVGSIPLSPLANMCLVIYRGEADYRQGLHNQGLDTLVTIGMGKLKAGETIRVGSGAHIDIQDASGDAKFIGVDSKGLEEMRMSVENDRTTAGTLGAQLLDPKDDSGVASGDALRIRVASATSSLTRVAKTGALALQDALRHVAVMIGANPEEVVVTPNLDFSAGGMTGKELLDLMMARASGAPLSLESIHKLMTLGDMTTQPYEEEVEEIDDSLGNEDADSE